MNADIFFFFYPVAVFKLFANYEQAATSLLFTATLPEHIAWLLAWTEGGKCENGLWHVPRV